MQYSEGGFICSDCEVLYETATDLLKHFAQHVREKLQKTQRRKEKQSSIPDLFPIGFFRDLYSGGTFKSSEKDENGDSGFEDPITLCEVSLTDDRISLDHSKVKKSRTYECKFCLELFECTTDLKEHKLKHGPRPFVCTICDITYTRKSLFQRHLKKHRKQKTLGSIPALKPIKSIRKQE